MKYIVRTFFVLLFLFYHTGTTAFFHTHVIDGVEAAHSHPFSKKNDHRHSDECFFCLLHFSQIDISISPSPAFFDILKETCFELFSHTRSFAYSTIAFYSFFQRPPPAI